MRDLKPRGARQYPHEDSVSDPLGPVRVREDDDGDEENEEVSTTSENSNGQTCVADALPLSPLVQIDHPCPIILQWRSHTLRHRRQLLPRPRTSGPHFPSGAYIPSCHTLVRQPFPPPY